MDLVSAAVGMQQASTMSQVQMKVARKILDMQEMQGAAVVKLINAASAGASQAGDQLAASATGLGGVLDTYA